MRGRSQQLSDDRWLLWLDARGRLTLPCTVLKSQDWRPGDTLGFEAIEGRGGFVMHNLSRDMRAFLAELEGLRGAPPGSQEDKRLDELASVVANLVDRLYPVDRANSTAAFGQLAFALTQTEEKMTRKGIKDKVDVILASIESRRLTHKTTQ